MSDSAGYASLRPELHESLARGDGLIARAMAAHMKSFKAGDEVIRAGAPHATVYRLRSGWVARARPLPNGRKQIMLVLLPGEFFGIRCMYLVRQPDTLECLSDAVVDGIEQERLRDLVRRDADVAERVMWQVLEDERRLHNWIVGLGRGEAAERAAAMLLDFRRRLHRLGLVQGDTSYRLPMTQQQIGDYLGLTPVHVNRVLKGLREAGLATVRRHTVTIHDAAALARLAAPVQDVFERTAPDLGTAGD